MSAPVQEVVAEMEARLTERIASLRKKGASERELRAVEEEFRRMKEEATYFVASLGTGFQDLGAESASCVGFSADGEWAWCGTEMGLRVWRWTELIAGIGKELPAPQWVYRHVGGMRAGGVQLAKPSGMVVEAIAGASVEEVLFSTVGGGIYRIAMREGDVRLVFSVPEGAVTRMALTGCGRGLATVSEIARFQGAGRRDYRAVLQVWDLEKLRGGG
ncbi:MAG: hypothetical protein ACTHN5_00540 [Phycisphaerae bacterium]